MSEVSAHAPRGWPQRVWVEGGWLNAGGDPQALNALPPQRWWVEPFWIGRDPVTLAEYLAFLNDLPRPQASQHVPGGLAPWLPEAQWGVSFSEGGLWVAASAAALRCPVVGVSWWSAVAYCGWLAERDRTPWRLPTELEWERAARGDHHLAFPWGDTMDPARCRMVATPASALCPSPIDAFPQDLSPFGVRGLGGNVADWCLDPYRYEGPPPPSPTASPTHPTAPRPTLCDAIAAALAQPADAPRVYRGGAWLYTADLCRAARRGINTAAYQGAHLGLRLACDGSAPAVSG